MRAIDLYVDTLDLEELGFLNADGGHAQGKGQPAYDPRDHLKLYLYGYLDKVRSSRMLERETHLNLEVIWLLGGLAPVYKTIADFRKDNADALKAVNRDFILLCNELGLYGGKKCAVDGSFFHGNASKASIYTKARLDKHQKKLEAEIERYQKELEKQDKDDEKADHSTSQKDTDLQEKLEALKKKQREKQALKDRLLDSGGTQISTTDEDASDVTHDGNDYHQLYPMKKMAMEALDVNEIEALADAGYFDNNQLKECEENGIAAYVPMPDKSGKKRAKGRFCRDDFVYDDKTECYRCPQGEALRRLGNPVYQKSKYWQRYASDISVCKACPLREKCLTEKARRRHLLRWLHEEVVDRHKERMRNANGKMRERSGLVEHPFGTLKHRAGWRHFLVRGFKKVAGEWALMATCYNFGRVLNIIGFDAFREYCIKRQQ